MTPDLAKAITLTPAVAAISMTVTKSKIFAGVRAGLYPTATVEESYHGWAAARYKLWELTRCPYCFSHWVSMLLTVIYHLRLVESGSGVVDWFMSSMILTGWSVIYIGLIDYAIFKRD